MKIGDKVKIITKRKTGEIYYDEQKSTRTATVVGKYKNFIVIQYSKGYKECFRESELVNG